MKNILIIQNNILHYRKSLYNELSKYYKVTILHSGGKSVEKNDSYSEIITKVRKIGPFFLQSTVLKEVKNIKYSAIIVMADIRWINNILAMYFHNKNIKFIWWGAWLTDNLIVNKIRIYLANKEYMSILYTNEAKDSFIKCGVNKNKLFVANNTFDVGKRLPSYNHRVKNRILFVGSLDKRKQNDILIKAFSGISNLIPNDINLTIVGDGLEKNNLEILVKNLKLENRVFFIGRVIDTNQLSNYYKEAIISVSFGQAGLSVLQSLGYGVPFMTKKNAISGGEKSNIKNGINGILCEDTLESLRENILKLCLDIDEARRLGKNAYEYYNQFCTIENMAYSFKDAINNKRIK